MRDRIRPFWPLVCTLTAALATAPALADRADSTRPAALSFDRRGTSDLTRGRTELVGDVMLSQGSTLLRADRAEVRQTSDGYYRATASGSPTRQASFRQGRDAPGAVVDGTADRLDYDARTASVRLLGQARMQVTGVQAEMDVTGAAISYDNRADVLVVDAGSQSPNLRGRGRIVYLPSAHARAAGANEAAAPLWLQPSLTPTAGGPPAAQNR